jgi:hypothetical protein
MKTNASLLSRILAVAALTAAGSVVATPIVTVGGTAVANNGLTTSVAGVAILDFNGSALPTGVTMSSAAGNLVTGSSAGNYAAPPSDTSQYLTVSPFSGTPVTISIAGGANYIGFYAGSVDSYNTITFVSTAGNVVYTGTQLATLAGVTANGNQGTGFYLNVFETGNAFTSVILASSQNAFELDNFAIGRAAPPGAVPLPGTVALMGLGMVAFAVRRNKK